MDGGTENNDRTLFRTPIKITNKPYVLKQNFHNENYRMDELLEQIDVSDA